MIEEQYVSFETAKLLKEKGFDIECNSFYRKSLKNNKIVDEPELYLSTFFKNNSGLKESDYSNIVYCTAPTQALAMRWLREIHHILISVNIFLPHKPTWIYSYYNLNRGYIRNKGQYNTYEEACEAAIQYCVKYLI